MNKRRCRAQMKASQTLTESRFYMTNVDRFEKSKAMATHRAQPQLCVELHCCITKYNQRIL